MRIVYCLLSPTFGMHQYTSDLANRMVEQHEVHLVTVANYPADRYSPAIHVHTPAELNGTGLSTESLSLKRLFQFKETLKLIKPDMVHFTGPHLWNPLLLYWLKRRRTPVIHTLHDLDPHSGTPLIPLLRLWNKVVIRLADRIVVHGQCYRERLIKAGISGDRVAYLPLLHLFLSYSRNRALIADHIEIRYEPFVLFFGRIESYKGIGTLIEAYQRYRAENTFKDVSPAGLIIAGSGEVPSKWRGSLPTGVEWFNRLILDEEAESLFQRCSIVVLPYEDATQSAIIGAAYFFRKPVIVTETGALPEYVLDGRSGLVVSPLDVAGLASALRIALSDSDELQTMGKCGRKWYDDQRRDGTVALATLYESASLIA